MTSKLKVLFLPRWYPCKDEPLHGIFVQRHARAISEFAEIIVLFATTDEKLKDKLFYSEIKSEKGLEEIIYYYKKNLTGVNFIDRILKFFLYFFCISKGYKQILKSDERPDLIHVHVLLRTLLFAVLLKMVSGIKIVYTEHWSGYHKEDGSYRGLKKWLSNILFKQVSRIMPVSEHLAGAMRSHGIKGNYSVIPNVVDLVQFRILEPFINKNQISAFHISNFDEKSKNIKGILEVVKEVSLQRIDFNLKVIGTGPSIYDIINYAKKLGLYNQNVSFVGPKYGHDLVREINECDFLFMFSNYENQPCVITEAMACGKPILATSVGGIPAMVYENVGILSPPGNVKSMAQKFNWMLDNLQSFSKDKIRSEAENYGYSKVGLQMFEVYKKVLFN